jgi:hypothetical protein
VGYAKILLSTTEIVTVLGAILIGFAVLAALIALIAAGIDHPVEGNWREISSYALILLLVISFCFIAYRFSVPRWYMHGISMGIILILGKAFDAPGLVLGLGIWVTLVGAFVLVQFMKQFPTEPDQLSEPQAEEDADASI